MDSLIRRIQIYWSENLKVGQLVLLSWRAPNWIRSVELEQIKRLGQTVEEQNAVLLRGRTSFQCTGTHFELSIERDR